MRFRSVIFFLWPVLFFIPCSMAQKRVTATVNPNAASLNGDADFYDPTTHTITPVTGKMNTAREQNIAVRMGDGKVLIAGGYNNRHLNTAEVFNPATGTFKETDNLLRSRSGAAAVLFQGGMVLIVGGYNGDYLSSAEIYDPATETFGLSVNSMVSARQNATATRLTSGRILIVGGYDGSAFLGSAEIYKPSTSLFYYTDGVMTDAREGHAATLLADGTVLITGGCNNSESGKVICDRFLDTAEIYDPDAGEFTVTGAMLAPRTNHTATLLSNGKVLIVGGSDGTNALASAEIYDPETMTFSAVGNMAFARTNQTASPLPDGKVLIAGGQSDQHLDTVEVFDPSTNTFTVLSSVMTTARSMHSAVVLEDGRVLLVGGENSELLSFDVNYQSTSDNISPTVVFSPDSKIGFVPYTGSGVIIAFSAETGAVLKRIITGGYPAFITPLLDGRTLAIVSVLDNRIFLVDMQDLALKATYSFTGTFGFGSILTLSPDGGTGYISSTATGEVIKFEVATGKELGRLTQLQAPAQITITKDGKTLLIVDVTAIEVIAVDPSTMMEKYRVTPLKGDDEADDDDDYATASFTIFNKVVLGPEETVGAVGSQDADSSSGCTSNGFFTFDISNGEILDIAKIGCSPGFTTLLPTGSFWVTIGQGNLSLVPTWSPDLSIVNSYTLGTPLSSANVLISPDSRYAYYALSSADLVVQQDIGTRGIVGTYPVGDNPNLVEDQASSLAITPDLKTIAVVNFTSNQLDLLTDSTKLRQTKYINYQNQFTGLSLVNLSNTPATLSITALWDSGNEYAEDEDKGEPPNPATLELGPNAQLGLDIGNLYGFDPDGGHTGYLLIDSDQLSIVGFSMTGKIKASFVDAYVSEMLAFPLQSDYRESLHNFIIPEIPQSDDASVELSFVNPNYNTSTYDAFHYGTDGTELEKKENLTFNGSVRETKELSDYITSIQSGRVLVSGGYDSTSTKNTAYTFDVSSNTFSYTATLTASARQGHSATPLQNQKVLIVGGKRGPKILRSAELYDPIWNYFLPTAGTPLKERYRHTATRLASGKVLIAGGQNSRSFNNTAELYDPLENAFEMVPGTMTSVRDAHTATLLRNGTVLLVGGIDGFSVSKTAELYNPGSRLFTATGSMSTPRVFHTAVRLPNEKVLIAGGYNGSYLSSVEIYDPSTGLFTPTSSMISARSNHTATLLSNGTILIAGGKDSTGPLNTAEIYDPATGTFLPTEDTMVSSRQGHTATLLNTDTDETGGDNDKVVLIGGYGRDIVECDDTDDDTTNDCENNDENDEENDDHALKTAELYDPVTQMFSRTSGDMEEARQSHTATLLEESDQGYLRIESEEGLLFNEIYDEGGASAAIRGIDIDKYAGVTKIYSPRFVIAPGYNTLLNIVNGNQDSEALVTIRLHAEDGSVLATSESWLLAKNAQLKGNLWDLFSNAWRLMNRTGWIEISSSVDRVVGTVSFMDSEDTYRTSAELSGTPMSRFVFPLVSEDGTYRTEISLLNAGDQTASTLLELWGPEGTLDAFVSVSLPPNGQVIGYLSDIFPGMQPHTSGNVRVQSDQPLHSLAILSARNLKFISAEPPVPYPGQ